MRMKPELFLYAALTLALLYILAGLFDPQPSPDRRQTACRVGYVYDGDTVEMRCGGDTSTARLVGFDTPETKDPGCGAERALGRQATLRLRELVANGEVALFPQGYDKYGRDLVRMEINGRDIAAQLVEEGLAVPYRGGTRINWCARLTSGEGNG